MATIEKRSSSDGVISWRVKIRIKGQTPINKTFSSHTLAKKWAKKTETDIEEGRYFPSTNGKSKTLNELIETYINHVRLDNLRRLNELTSIMDWWKAEFGHKLLSEFSGETFISARHRLSKKLTNKKDADGTPIQISPSTMNRYTVALNTTFNFCVEVLKWLPVNPLKGVKKFQEPEGRTRFLDTSEIDRLITACINDESPHIFAAVLLGMSTGRRKSAIMNLQWKDIDLDTGRVLFREQKTKSFISSTISGCTLELLRRKSAEYGDTEIWVFPSHVKPGAPIDIRAAWERVRTTAQLSDFRFHDLKHTCASYMAMNGASLIELSKVLGHKTLDMVLRYSHLTEDHTAAIQKKMNEKVLGHVKL